MILAVVAASWVGLPVSAISEKQESAVATHCEAIKDSLKNTQRADARARVYLGGHYETILTKFVTPLNLRLVENNLSTGGLVENQTKMAKARTLFVDDYVSYQQGLEELIKIDCKENPGEFYAGLEKVRQGRKTVEKDVARIRSLIAEHGKLVTALGEGLK